MSELMRPLLNDTQIISFLSAIEFEKYFSDEDNFRRVFPKLNDINIALAESITLIKEANNDLVNMVKYNTFDSTQNRSSPYKTDEDRENLRQEIMQQLITQVRPSNDEQICYGTGGMLPCSGIVDKNRKAFIIIGLPASGKSGIAAKVSDYYHAVLIDSDFAKRKFPEFCKRNGATLVHKESKLIKDEIIRAAICQKLNFVLPIIGNDYDEVLNTIKSISDHKYKVSLILVELDRVEATRRAFNRFIQTKRYIPLSKILDEYSNDPSLVFYKLLHNKKLSMALLNTDVPFGEKPNIVVERNYKEIHTIIKEEFL